jgi:putative ABC transport system ATP-binding protein
MTDALIEAVEVAKVLGSGPGQVQALEGISLSVKGGELALLMGPSGSGKTTLLSVLGCMLTPTSGKVWVRGRSTEGTTAEELAKLRRDNVGFVFQTYHLFPTLNATDNVRLALDVRGERTKAAVVKAKDALTNVGLSHKVASYPHELSAGEQQRVAIARAIVGDVSAIFADEPTAALDTENGKAIMTILSSIAKDRSRGVLVVTHDARLMPFADRVIYLEDGRIIRKEKKSASDQ